MSNISLKKISFKYNKYFVIAYSYIFLIQFYFNMACLVDTNNILVDGKYSIKPNNHKLCINLNMHQHLTKRAFDDCPYENRNTNIVNCLFLVIHCLC